MDVSKNACGECSVCCEALTFDLAGARKVSGAMCPHCRAPAGCGIYQTREQVCRTYFCGWQHLGLAAEWRPDKSGILISLRSGPAPDGGKDGIEFHLVGAPDTLFWMPLIQYIAALIEDRVPVYLSLAGEAGFQSPWVYLNNRDDLKDGISRRDLALTKAALTAARQLCLDAPKAKIPLL